MQNSSQIIKTCANPLSENIPAIFSIKDFTGVTTLTRVFHEYVHAGPTGKNTTRESVSRDSALGLTSSQFAGRASQRSA